MVVLVTAFDPFGGEEINASWEALKLLSEEIAGHQIIKKQLPTVFRKSFYLLNKYIDELKPDVVISLGQAAGRKGISVERVAINIDDARIPDNEGNHPIDEKIVEGATEAYLSTLPIKAMVADMNKMGIEATISNTAGTFVCNHIMYLILHYANIKAFKYIGGFIHIPCIKEQSSHNPQHPFMELQEIVRGLEIAIETTCSYKQNI